MNTPEKQIHQGRNVKRFREMLGLKQDALAMELGISQQSISILEAKEILDADILAQVAKILKVPEEAIKNFDEEQAINIISNTFHREAFIGNTQSTFNINPVDEWMKALGENKALYEENKKLYERLLASEKEKVELLKSKG